MKKLLMLALCAASSVALAQTRTVPERAPERTTPEAAEWMGVRVCNRSNDDVQIAKGLATDERDDAGNRYVVTEGWWRVNRGECRVIYPGEIRYRYYLVYAFALAPGTGDWAGNVWACVSKDAFTIRVSECHGGYNRRRFQQIDTGSTTDRFTFNLNP